VQTKVRDVREKKRGTMTSGQFFFVFGREKGGKEVKVEGWGLERKSGCGK
jgi:hypothetical protein